MNVLALTHAHLTSDGLSPVSCERADSIVNSWGLRRSWDIDVIYTSATLWRGIWPSGEGLHANIIRVDPPEGLRMEAATLFSSQVRNAIANKQLLSIVPMVGNRISHRFRVSFARRGWLRPQELISGQKWGQYIASLPAIAKKRYDFIFVTAGYGDEYLLKTAFTLSRKLDVPMIVDFRDLWSDHHDPNRFTEDQKTIIRRFEKRLLSRTVLISVPQKHMAGLLGKWLSQPVHVLSHSAYVAPEWEDSHVISDEYTLVYAGKLYPNAPGIWMLMEFLSKLKTEQLHKQFKCHFFVDDPEGLQEMAEKYEVTSHIVINGWLSPHELWPRLRSAHLLLLPDGGIAENYPLLPTKIFQYAYTGQQILCLEKYHNEEIDEFLDYYQAGMSTTDVDLAVAWTVKQAAVPEQYQQLPPLRNVAQREDQALIFADVIDKIMTKKNNFTANE